MGARDDDFPGGDFAERDAVERLAIATDTFPRAVIAGHDASVLRPESLSGSLAAEVLQREFCSGSLAAGVSRHLHSTFGSVVDPIGRSVLLRRISLHVSNAAISPGLALAVRGK
jgi:hypothetical protein